jgi:Spy/CpxP family protein refolding chaperone
MKIAMTAALLAAFCLPISVSAQAYPQQPVTQAPGGRGNSGEHAYKRWMKRLSSIGLSSQQQQQVQSVLGQYAQQHPAGSPRDPQGAHALRDQIYSILSPQQQAQLQANMQAQRAARQANHQQMQQQQLPPGQPPTR